MSNLSISKIVETVVYCCCQIQDWSTKCSLDIAKGRRWMNSFEKLHAFILCQTLSIVFHHFFFFFFGFFLQSLWWKIVLKSGFMWHVLCESTTLGQLRHSIWNLFVGMHSFSSDKTSFKHLKLGIMPMSLAFGERRLDFGFDYKTDRKIAW